MKTMKEIDNEARYFTDNRIKCKCGHSLLITSKDGKELCTWCNNYAFINKEAELKYKNKAQIEKLRRELNGRR